MGEIIGEFIIYILLNYIGGSIRWLFGTLWRALFNTPKYTFKEYIHGPEDSDHYDSAHGCINTIIAIAFIALVVIIISTI